MAEKDVQLQQIAAQLQPKYAQYLIDRSNLSDLTAAERRVLNAVRNNPSESQLESLYQFTKFSYTDFMVRERSFGFLATALGMPPQESRSLWQRLNRMTPLTGPGGRKPEPVEPYSSGRVPGEGSMRGGDPIGVGAPVARSEFVDAVLSVMGDDFVAWYEGDSTALGVSDRAKISQALSDPNNPDMRVLAEFSIMPPDRFLEYTSPIISDLSQRGMAAVDVVEDARQGVSERLEPYYDPNLSTVVYLNRADAQAQVLRSATSQQIDEADQIATSGAGVPDGYEYQYDPVQSKPVLVKIGTTLPGGGGTAGDTADGSDGFDGLGGGGGGGGTGGGGTVTAPAAEQPVDTGVPTDWQTAAAEMYPEYYAIVRNNPEIADLLRRSIGPPEWSEQKFQAELRGTNWYKTTTASAREWDAASQLDPATYQTRVDEAATTIRQTALELGVRLSDEQLQKLALDSQRLGWGSQTIINAIGMRATEAGSAGATQLREGYYGQSVRQLARQYGVALDSTTFNSFVNRIAVGDETLGSFQDYAMTIAKSMYPPLAEQFDAGRTFEDVTSNYRTMAAQVLERDPNSIDMMGPEWVQAVTYMPDPKTGEQRMMNLQEWGNYLRTTDSFGYEFTSQAQSRAYEVADKIANMFGRI